MALTEYESNYKRVNLDLINSYISLMPLSVSKVSHCLFNLIIETKRYARHGSIYYNEAENNRIYSNKYIALEEILDRLNPSKYKMENKKKENDISNLQKLLRKVHEENIFYCWRFGFPHTYMFIMERDIGVWKLLNSQGCVTPRTVSKIVDSSIGMVNTMLKIDKQQKRNFLLKDIEQSFVNDLLYDLFNKMDSSVASKLPRQEDLAFEEYMDVLSKSLSKMNPHEGLKIDSSFYKNIPDVIENNIKLQKSKKMENDLIPQNEDLTKEKNTGSRNKKAKKNSNEKINAKVMKFSKSDPLGNCNDFIHYYREGIRSVNSGAKFYDLRTERAIATTIMDTILENNGDVDFLRSWLKYHINYFLNKGKNMYNKEKTSLKVFFDTFEEYKGKYFSG